MQKYNEAYFIKQPLQRYQIFCRKYVVEPICWFFVELCNYILPGFFLYVKNLKEVAGKISPLYLPETRNNLQV